MSELTTTPTSSSVNVDSDNESNPTNNTVTQSPAISVENTRRSSNNNNEYLKNFKVSTPEIGAVISLPTERVSNDKGFDHFKDTLENYILKNLSNATDVLPLLKNLQDPTIDFVKNNMPAPHFTEEEIKIDAMKKAVNDQIAKQFAIRIGTLNTNVTKIYGYIWGQCTPGVQADIKSKKDFETESSKYNALWLLLEVKKISAGVYTRGNGYRSMYEILNYFFTGVKQGERESEECWYKRFKTECDTLTVAGLDFIFLNMTVASLPKNSSEIKKMKLVSNAKLRFF